MSGSEIKISKIVIDTNVIFMALYNQESKAGRVIQFAIDEKIELFSTDSAKEEISRVLKKEMKLDNENTNFIISSLPITWIHKEVYQDNIKNTKVKHKSDKPIEALALTLKCNILSADKHFKDLKNKIDINKLLEKYNGKEN